MRLSARALPPSPDPGGRPAWSPRAGSAPGRALVDRSLMTRRISAPCWSPRIASATLRSTQARVSAAGAG
eukprot:7045087-Lingulodinium_polyedra.AAC.1